MVFHSTCVAFPIVRLSASDSNEEAFVTRLRSRRPELRKEKWARQGSNLRPKDYESSALTN